MFELFSSAYYISLVPEIHLSLQFGKHPSRFPHLQQMARFTTLFKELLKGK